jgi:GNAT superfamily N-acetyltransferase
MTSVMTHTPNCMTTVMMEQALGPRRVGSEVVVLGPTAADLEAVLAMLARCSGATRFHRFHGVTDGVAYYVTLFQDRPVDHTLLAWHGSSCVGVANLGVGATGDIDLAVLVEDAWQRRGIGSRLTASLLDSARARGVPAVHADVLGDDPFIVEGLRRIGPLTVSIEFGIYSIDIDISRRPEAGSVPPPPWRLPLDPGPNATALVDAVPTLVRANQRRMNREERFAS